MEYNTVQLLNGIVMVPNDFITVDATVTTSANYAGVVAEKNGTLPHFLVLSEKPICELTAEEEDKIYDLCGEIYPEVIDVRAKEIEAEFDEAGFVTNGDEWKKAPRLGIFGIHEVKDEHDLYLGTGIIRRA